MGSLFHRTLPSVDRCVFLPCLSNRGAWAFPRRLVYPIHSAAQKGDLAKVKALIAQDPPRIGEGQMGATPLHMAARKDHKDVAEFLLGERADVNAKDTTVDLLRWILRSDLHYIDVVTTCLVDKARM